MSNLENQRRPFQKALDISIMAHFKMSHHCVLNVWLLRPSAYDDSVKNGVAMLVFSGFVLCAWSGSRSGTRYSFADQMLIFLSALRTGRQETGTQKTKKISRFAYMVVACQRCDLLALSYESTQRVLVQTTVATSSSNGSLPLCGCRSRVFPQRHRCLFAERSLSSKFASLVPIWHFGFARSIHNNLDQSSESCTSTKNVLLL